MTNIKENNPLLYYILMILVVIICSLFIFRNDIDDYEYVDKSGRTGYSKKCVPGGVYSTCYSDDGTPIKVIRYHEFKK